MGGKTGGIFKNILDPGGLIFKDEAPKIEAPKIEEPVALPQTPSEADADVRLAAEDERRKRRAALGSSATLLTGGLGNGMDTGVGGTVTTQKKTLLGG